MGVHLRAGCLRGTVEGEEKGRVWGTCTGPSPSPDIFCGGPDPYMRLMTGTPGSRGIPSEDLTKAVPWLALGGPDRGRALVSVCPGEGRCALLRGTQ